MLHQFIGKGIEKIASETVKHGTKLLVATGTAIGTLVVEEYRKARAVAKARKEGEKTGFSQGYDTAKREDKTEINKARAFMRKILNKK